MTLCELTCQTTTAKAMRVKFNYLKGYEFDESKAASHFNEELTLQSIDRNIAITVQTLPREAYLRVGCGHRVGGDGMLRFIFVLDAADDLETLENKPFVFEELDSMFKQATELVLSGPFVYVSED